MMMMPITIMIMNMGLSGRDQEEGRGEIKRVLGVEHDGSTSCMCICECVRVCEDSIMKAPKCCLKRGGEGSLTEYNRGDEFDQITLYHLWKYHNETPLSN
jgi:hypothetical protein